MSECIYFKMEILVNENEIPFAIKLSSKKRIDDELLNRAMNRIACYWLNAKFWNYEGTISEEEYENAFMKIKCTCE